MERVEPIVMIPIRNGSLHKGRDGGESVCCGYDNPK